jgi:hypothetical protein
MRSLPSNIIRRLHSKALPMRPLRGDRLLLTSNDNLTLAGFLYLAVS